MGTPRYFHAGWLIDGNGAPVRNNVLLTVADGRFTAIDEFDGSRALDPALVTDLSHCTVLPPFVDSHVHLSLSGTVDPGARERQLTACYPVLQPVIARHLRYHLSHGVLAVRDGGDKNGHVLRYKKEYSGRAHIPVILKAAGRAWHQQGRYGSQLGRHPGDHEPLSTALAGENEPIDHVKLVNSGPNSLSEFGRETDPQFSLEEMKKTVFLAARQGKRVMVHANGRIPVRLALEAGCHSIEHGFFMGRENIARMAAQQTVWVPTAFAMKACLDNPPPDGRSHDPQVVRKTLDHQLEQLALAREYGVQVALGTDSGCRGVLHGEAFVEELKLFMRAGYSLPEAVQCATGNGSRLLGIENQMGIIAREKPAHFLVARGVPAQLPRKLSSLEAVYLDGNPCDGEWFHKI